MLAYSHNDRSCPGASVRGGNHAASTLLTPNVLRIANLSLVLPGPLQLVGATRADHRAVATEVVPPPLDMEEDLQPLVADVKYSSITSVVPNRCPSLALRTRLC